jgi:RNA polymerase sigma factor (sigma-70 family)
MRTPSRPDESADPLTQLADRAQSGDRGAFEQLLRRLEPGLKRILLRRTGGQAELTDELTQRTWIAVWEALRDRRYDRRKAAISTFAYAVAHKLWLQHLRQTGHTPISHGWFDAALLSESQASDNPATLLEASELLEAVRACLHATGTPFSLTAEERRIIIGLAAGESERVLAEQLGVAASTIHARKQLAYRKLRKCLVARGFSMNTAERRDVERE